MPALSPFFEEQAVRSAIQERRVWVRYCCELDVFCTDAGIGRPPRKKRSGSGISDLNKHWPAKVYDISRGGLKLETSHPFKNDALFELELEGVSSGETTVLRARVKHSFESDDNVWTLGCAFPEPLDDGELQALLRFGPKGRQLVPESFLTRLSRWFRQRFSRDRD